MALSTQQSPGQSGPETRRAERRSSGGPRADVTAGRSAGDPARPIRAAGGHVTGRRQLTERGGRRRLKVDSHWRPAVRSPAQYGPERARNARFPSGTDRKLLNGPGSDVN